MLSPSMCTRKVLSPAVCPASSFSLISGSPAAARSVGSQSWWETMPLSVLPAANFPGQRTKAGTRQAPSQLVFFSLRKGVMAPSGQVL